MSLILVLLIPLATAILLIPYSQKLRWQFAINLTGTVLQTIAAVSLMGALQSKGMIVLQVGNWPAPYGITLVADLLSGILVILSAFTALAVSIYSFRAIPQAHVANRYYPLMQFMLMGINGAFLTGDLFNLYVWFEVLLISSFGLISLKGSRKQFEGAFKYVTMNMVASLMFLTALGLIYGISGTLNMADLARKVSLPGDHLMLQGAALLLMTAFGIKAAVFPLYFWLPASYHTAPIPIAAIFAGLLTKVGVYSLIRVYTLIFITDTGFTHTLLLILALLTMISGVLGAAVQSDFRRILSFHSISQIGYMVLGLALFSPLALAGAVFYLMHHSIVKSNLFLVAGMVHHLKGRFNVYTLGGIYQRYPWLAILFFIPAFSLAGIPPLSGFWAKLFIIKAGLDLQAWISVTAALVVGLLTLYSMTKIWAQVFWKNDPQQEKETETAQAMPVSLWLPVAGLGLAAILIGIGAGPVFDMTNRAAEQLLDNTIYINAVLGE
jgi:multicomponent Na+:H+ antiporter subunit D